MPYSDLHQGLLSDGLLAWRFSVIFGNKPWARWCPLILVLINTRTPLKAYIIYFRSFHWSFLSLGTVSQLTTVGRLPQPRAIRGQVTQDFTSNPVYLGLVYVCHAHTFDGLNHLENYVRPLYSYKAVFVSGTN